MDFTDADQVETSAELARRHGIHGTAAFIRAVARERDALAAEVARLRAVADAGRRLADAVKGLGGNGEAHWDADWLVIYAALDAFRAIDGGQE